jgi:hypothetical protein
MNYEKMIRVTKNRPCPVCGKPDWCLVSSDNSAAICARIQEGSVKHCGDAGWLHILSDGDKQRKHHKKIYVRISNDFGIHWESMASKYHEQITRQQTEKLAESLGVTIDSLRRLRVGWDGKAYAFPMCDDKSRTIGIRRRFPNGAKLSAKGSKTGLFIPSDLRCQDPLLICEGATDTAAAIDLGFDAIGRPNCNSQIGMTVKAAAGYNEIVIVADNDEAGKAGAKKLADALALHCPLVKIIYPAEGIKDLRQWLHTGLKNEQLNQIIGQARKIELEIRFKDES